MISDSTLERALAEDVECVAGLDERGFLVGAGETAGQYVARLKALRERFEGMEQALADGGVYEIEGLKFPADRRIAKEMVEDVGEVTRRHYGFAIDWVPGFFVGQSFGWLFGGCAYYFDPEHFAVFILRRSFARRKRWLIYNRDELLAHELCHVARSGLDSAYFEEEFAYGVSSSAFRKMVGGMFRTGNEAYYILGCAMLLLAVQVARLFVFHWLPIWPFWLLLAGVVSFLVARLVRMRRLIRSARAKLRPVAGEHTEHVLFRCTDGEICRIAESADTEGLRQWLEGQSGGSLRWRVVRHRFLANGESPEAQSGGDANMEEQRSAASPSRQG
jgi:hypothetical protein